MGRLFVASVLMSISSKPQPATAADLELKPMTPGAWAAWARDWESPQTSLTAESHPAPVATTTILRPAGSKA